MATIASLVVRLLGDTTSFDSSMKKAEGTLDRLKASFGGRSDFKELMEILKGGGAIVGLTLAARAVRDMAQAAVEFRREMEAGALSAEEVRFNLVKKLPIIGALAEGIEAIDELFGGERAELERITAEMKKQAELEKKRLDGRLKLSKELQSIASSAEQEADSLLPGFEQRGKKLFKSISELDELVENLRSAQGGVLKDEQLKIIEQTRRAYARLWEDIAEDRDKYFFEVEKLEAERARDELKAIQAANSERAAFLEGRRRGMEPGERKESERFDPIAGDVRSSVAGMRQFSVGMTRWEQYQKKTAEETAKARAQLEQLNAKTMTHAGGVDVSNWG